MSVDFFELFIYSLFSTRLCGTKFVKGRYPGSKAIAFDQSESFASAPIISINNKNFTIACWIKVAFIRKFPQAIYGDWFSPWQFFFYISDAGNLAFERHLKIPYGWWNLVSGTIIPLNQWIHVAVTWKQNQGLGQLYMDAVEVGNKSFNLSDKFYEPTSQQYQIGNNGHWQDHQFYGAIMDLYVLDVAMSPDELNHLRGGYVLHGRTDLST